MQINDLPSFYLQSPKLNQLNILKAVAANSRITQSELAKQCVLSVAMVNNYMKELCHSGCLEYHRRTIKSVTYHLTASGTMQLESLQGELVREMVGMFVAAKEQLRTSIMSQTRGQLWRVILYGTGHLAQLTFHALDSTGVNILGICNDDIEIIGSDFCGRQVMSPSQIRFLAPDAVIVADLARTEEICRSVGALLNPSANIIRLDKQINQNLTGSSGTNPPIMVPEKTLAKSALSLISSPPGVIHS